MSELRKIVYMGTALYIILGIVGILLWDISSIFGIIGIVLLVIALLQFFRVFTFEEEEISKVEKTIMLIINFIPNIIVHTLIYS